MKQRSLPIVIGIFLVVAMTVQFFVSYQREKTNLMQQMEYKMDLAQKDFLFEVYDIHEATDEISHFFLEFDDNSAELYSLLEAVLWHYPDLYCCYVTFLPECSPTPGQWSCPTAFRVKKDSIITYDAKNHIPYAERDWFQGALRNDSDEGYWSMPYNDGTHEDPVFTYSQKVYDSNGKLMGVAGSDYTLVWTKRLLEDIKPYDDAICQLFSSDGTLIVGSGDTTNIHDRILFEKVLAPTNMRLMISVPKCHIRREITSISLITLAVLLAGILAIGLLLNHVRREHDALTRVETANRVLEREMQIASGIQLGMLPKEKRESSVECQEDVQVEAKLIPMREVGGDLYDFHREKDELWFIIGDVSGKGVPAAMFMSAAVNLFRAAGGRAHSPKEIMEEMNKVLSENNPSMMFVTAFIGRLHVPTGELTYCNAGHCQPIKVSGLEVSGLELEPNMPLGYEGKFRFVEQGVMLGEGDTIVLYTDGITEARNEQRQMLGFAKWAKIVKSGKWNVESLLREVKTFIGSAEPTDDITLMTVRKTSAVEPMIQRVENRIDRWPVLRVELHNYGLCAGLDARALKKTEVAIEEAVVNIVNYSQAEWMELEVNELTNEGVKELVITLRDNGVAFDPTQQAEIDTDAVMAERQIGGLGIALLRKIADDVRYERIDEINTLTIIKNI
ncbi:MAG: SpoIIE family protein phosphatase [Paludibacteraceae bacterium]|nr:SpoIIE family protein phosphatase [Paludibacteraceae bacterium]